MFNGFIKKFVKNADDVDDPKVRERYGRFTGITGIILNTFMCLAKIIVGIVTGAISVVSDGVNNLSDAGSSIITFVGFKLSGKKPDRKHPYGHGRTEYFVGLAVSAVIIFVAVQLLMESISDITGFNGSDTSVDTLFLVTVAILGFSICIKLFMAMLNYHVGKKINSVAIKANYADSLSDCFSTAAVLLCFVLSLYVKDFPLDGVAGVLVSLFVAYSGIRSLIEVISPLMGEAPDPETVKNIKNFVLNYGKEVVGVHDIMVHDYGPGRKIIVLHAEVPAEGDIMELHDTIDNIERAAEKEFNCIATIHMDPVVTKSERVNQLKKKCLEIAKSVDEDFDIHDFRMNEGKTHANVIFDLSVPFDSKYTTTEAKKIVEEKIKEYDEKLNAVIVAENPLA